VSNPNLPDRPPGAGKALSERRLSSRDFELVIRRAAELQAREAEDPASDGMTEAEVLRIGRELGLSTQYLHRALAEVEGSATEESGVFVKLFGPVHARAGRAVRGEPTEVSRVLERYLVEREYLAVLRRFHDRVLFTRARGMVAAMGRASSQIFSRSPMLPVSNLEMAVHPMEEGVSFVGLATSLGSQRNATAAASLVGGGTGASLSGAILGIAIAPPAALIALPILGFSVWAGHAYYDGVVRNIQTQLESLLDRLEHGELPGPNPRWQPPRR
jgi:hypothetical protein